MDKHLIQLTKLQKILSACDSFKEGKISYVMLEYKLRRILRAKYIR